MYIWTVMLCTLASILGHLAFPDCSVTPDQFIRLLISALYGHRSLFQLSGPPWTRSMCRQVTVPCADLQDLRWWIVVNRSQQNQQPLPALHDGQSLRRWLRMWRRRLQKSLRRCPVAELKGRALELLYSDITTLSTKCYLHDGGSRRTSPRYEVLPVYYTCIMA